jgi:hypothetical protein
MSLVYKQRASGAGLLLTNPRTIKDRENGVLAMTVQTMLQDWIKEQIYGRRKEIRSKYLDKGIAVETESLRWMANVLDLGLILEMNEQSFEDEFFTGTPDLILPDIVYDLKNSWDYTTFPLFGGEPDPKYVAQLQVYMHLTGRKKAGLVYLLSNTPDYLVAKDVNNKLWEFKEKNIHLTEDQKKEVTEEVFAYHNYDNIQDQYKYKTFYFDYDEAMITELQDRVFNARIYIDQLYTLVGL